uniref:Uncharacterized protein n=1 Tax=Anguilla anguilla TaxID=7936 RepID=A0A0E9SUT3_ANGAN
MEPVDLFFSIQRMVTFRSQIGLTVTEMCQCSHRHSPILCLVISVLPEHAGM